MVYLIGIGYSTYSSGNSRIYDGAKGDHQMNICPCSSQSILIGAVCSSGVACVVERILASVFDKGE